MNTSLLFPYLNFDGNCREAMDFYKSVLGGELSLQTGAETPMEMPEEAKNRIINAELHSDKFRFMASDTMMGDHFVVGNNVHMSLSSTDTEELTKNFTALSEGGVVDMPLAMQFWGDTFGMLTDKFGIHWMVNITAENNKHVV